MLAAWLALAVVVGAGWLLCHVVLRTVVTSRIVLSSRSYDGPPPNAPKVSVVLAAKDEQGDIEACVTSLLDQDYPDYELIVVDDRSRDQTPVILERLQREFGHRLRVLRVQGLRDGWCGKNNAMREGVAASSGQWLLFTDADCRAASRKTLSMAMREALHKEVAFLSIAPVLETRTVWEHVLQPACAAVLMSWFLPQRVNDAQKPTAYANGAFMLMRRTCYELIGGHHRVRGQLNEDIGMARLAKERGLHLRLVENDDLYHTRMYDTLAAAWQGWSRIFYGCLQSLTRLSVMCGVLILFCLGPWVGLLVAVAGRDSAPAESTALWSMVAGVWAVVLVLEQAAWWRVYGILRMRPAWSLTYPLGALAALGMLVHAMLKATGATTTTWRGTTYRRGGCARTSRRPRPRLGHQSS